MDSRRIPRELVDDPEVLTLVDHLGGDVADHRVEGEVFEEGVGPFEALAHIVRLRAGIVAVAELSIARVAGKNLEAEWIPLGPDQDLVVVVGLPLLAPDGLDEGRRVHPGSVIHDAAGSDCDVFVVVAGCEATDALARPTWGVVVDVITPSLAVPVVWVAIGCEIARDRSTEWLLRT